MSMTTLAYDRHHSARLFKRAFALAIITIAYNAIEGVVSMWFGLEDEALTLFGFGADSFIETISALGVAHMIVRIRAAPDSGRDAYEIAALKITGWCFYILAAVLTISAIISVIEGLQPTSTIAGIVISSLSIIAMWALIRAKRSVGHALNSAPLLADANCNLVCMYMSLILLASSGLYALFGIPYIDAVGAMALVYFSIREGREAFAKAKGIDDCCSDGC